MKNFVHLHLHTEYSLLDGAVRLTQSVIEQNEKKKSAPLADRLKELNMTSCAITDHGNMYGVYTFVESMRKAKIKPIIGQEFYVADDMLVKNASVLRQRYHLVLLAKNMVGYKNLMKLSSMAFVDGFYMKPRIDMKTVSEHSEGLICLSACLAGEIPRLLLKGDYEGAKAKALDFKNMFDEGDFYIELQDHGLEEDKLIMNNLCQIAKEIGVKLVATNDVHYINKEDADIQDTMMCVNLQCKKSEINIARFTNDEFYLKSYDEMEKLFGWCPESLTSTQEIADKIDGDYFVLYNKDCIIPVFKDDFMCGRNTAQYLHDIAWEKISNRYDDITDDIKNRLEYELSVITDCGFDDYFLIVWDYCKAAREMNIPVGPGRGSGVGSIVAYALEITDVDPLKYNLLFERFLSKERVSMPDFDIDFCIVGRPKVIEYCVNKYKKENVSQIIAYSKMSAKAVVKDVARVFEVPYNEVNSWVKEIPVGKVLIKQVLTEGNEMYNEDFLKIYQNNLSAQKVIDTAIKLEGMPRQASMHAAGLVICGDAVHNYVAQSKNGNDVITQFDKIMIEKLGLLKFDFLGLKNLTNIAECIKYIKEDKNIDIDFHKIGYEDHKVYELISSGDCDAIFQLERGGMKKWMTQLQPSNLEEVMAGISMYRPGPMQFINVFLDGKKNPAEVKYDHPILKDILNETYGCIVYQEQVMHIAQKIAGYSFGGADIMRRVISKKDVEKLQKQKDIFINGGVLDDDKTKTYIIGAVANGVDAEIAEKLFNQIMKFANYAFNKSHAAAYSFITYQTAYLKCYYPTHFMTAVVNNCLASADETRHYINYMKRIGIQILSPDINKSGKLFSIDGTDVRYGLMGVKGVGNQAIEYVLAERQMGEFKNVKDLIARCSGQINKRMLESLIKGGAFDSFGKTRATLIASYEKIMDVAIQDKKSKISGQMSLFDELIPDEEVRYNERPEYEKLQFLFYEKEVLGMYVSGHPLEEYSDEENEFNFDSSMLTVIESNEDGESVKIIDRTLANEKVSFGCMLSSFEQKITKKQQKFAVGMLEDRQGVIAFVMFSNAYKKFASFLEENIPLKVVGKLDLNNESEPKVNVEKIEFWENNNSVIGKSNKSIIMYIRIRDVSEKNLVIGVLSIFPGNTICRLQITEKGKSRLVEVPSRVDVSEELIRRIKNIVGEDGVICKEI